MGMQVKREGYRNVSVPLTPGFRAGFIACLNAVFVKRERDGRIMHREICRPGYTLAEFQERVAELRISFKFNEN